MLTEKDETSVCGFCRRGQMHSLSVHAKILRASMLETPDTSEPETRVTVRRGGSPHPVGPAELAECVL